MYRFKNIECLEGSNQKGIPYEDQEDKKIQFTDYCLYQNSDLERLIHLTYISQNEQYLALAQAINKNWVIISIRCDEYGFSNENLWILLWQFLLCYANDLKLAYHKQIHEYCIKFIKILNKKLNIDVCI